MRPKQDLKIWWFRPKGPHSIGEQQCVHAAYKGQAISICGLAIIKMFQQTIAIGNEPKCPMCTQILDKSCPNQLLVPDEVCE
jgi:hypothetical protein